MPVCGTAGHKHKLNQPRKDLKCVISTRSPRTRKRSARCSASSTATSVTCRQCGCVFSGFIPRPMIRNAGSEREPGVMTLGMPPASQERRASSDQYRNTASPHWRGWLRPENRCVVVPSTASPSTRHSRTQRRERRMWSGSLTAMIGPLTAFAGIWTGVQRRSAPLV